MNDEESYSEVVEQFFGAAIRIVTLSLFLVVFGANAALAHGTFE
jgi:hypothetical protein